MKVLGVSGSPIKNSNTDRAGMVIAPAGIYLLAGWPGWEQIYWSKRFEEVMHTGWANALLPALFVLFIMLAAYAGHVLGYRWLTTHLYQDRKHEQFHADLRV